MAPSWCFGSMDDVRFVPAADVAVLQQQQQQQQRGEATGSHDAPLASEVNAPAAFALEGWVG